MTELKRHTAELADEAALPKRVECAVCYKTVRVYIVWGQEYIGEHRALGAMSWCHGGGRLVDKSEIIRR